MDKGLTVLVPLWNSNWLCICDGFWHILDCRGLYDFLYIRSDYLRREKLNTFKIT